MLSSKFLIGQRLSSDGYPVKFWAAARLSDPFYLLLRAFVCKQPSPAQQPTASSPNDWLPLITQTRHARRRRPPPVSEGHWHTDTKGKAKGQILLPYSSHLAGTIYLCLFLSFFSLTHCPI